jgi:hypothetical protein
MTATPWQPVPEIVGQASGYWRSPGYRSSRLRSQVLRVVVAATVAVNAIFFLLALQGFDLVDRLVAGVALEREAGAYDTLVAQLAIVSGVLYYATALALLAWLSRVVENVPPLTGRTPVRSPKEAIGWWLVPFANYVVPFQIVLDTLRRLRTTPASGAERLIVPWWLLFVAGVGIGVVEFSTGADPVTLDEVHTLLVLRVLDGAVYVAGGILLFLIVREAQARSDQRAAALGLGDSSVPQWPVFAAPRPTPLPRGAWPIVGEPVVTEVASADGPPAPPPPPGMPAAGEG